MSDYLTSGELREWKSHRLQLNVNLVQRFDELSDKPTLSRLMNDLLNDWVVTQEIKLLLRQ